MITRTFVAKYGSSAFLPPPFPGTETICPITCYRDLKEEGRTMHHCVGSYSGRVMSGSTYIYRVLEPERATLELCFNNSTGAWEIGQLHLVCNGTPLNVTRESVAKWLEKEKLQELRRVA
ncbi:MAG: PcfJ domain-containing protein [Chitinispirillaceae bacterium]|nr:PcfJ domain-containing protein [Chitinispirillaceae bacterium]